MASASSPPSDSSLGSSSRPLNYDVFLSFRGRDLRKTFVDHFFAALVDRQIITYKDDRTLPRGETIGPSLFEAIKQSRIAVIVFSKNYAESWWCLKELTYIMKCRDEMGLIVMPIFYDVDPSEVRKQKGDFGNAFAKQERENTTKLAESWRKALVDATNIGGWEPKNIANGHESQVIKEIVDTIFNRLFSLNSDVDEDLVGMKARLLDIESRLDINSGGVRMVGIWGIGGSGKTTLAASIYMKIHHHFQGQCVIENIREESSKYGLKVLQENLLSAVFKTKVKLFSVLEGKNKIKDMLCDRKVLLLLDDVNSIDQLEMLAGSHKWFGSGSRIIVTTRDEQLLKIHKVDEVYPVRLLSRNEAIQLFNKHAFKEKHIVEDYKTLSLSVVSYAAGLPLALKILGCFLCYQEKNVWMDTLARLKDIPEMEIMEKLKISYDGLKDVEKKLFLDIVCFFRGEDTSYAIEILEACDFHPVVGIEVLRQKALISIVDGRFDMHDLVQEMGNYIVRGEHPRNPEKHSRLWKVDEIKNMCFEDATLENDKIEAIAYNGYSHGRDISLRFCKTVSNMKNLRWLKVRMRDGKYVEGPNFLSNELRYIDWSGYPASELPHNFILMKLVVLKLWGSLQKEVWGFKLLPHLKVLQLFDMEELQITPNFDDLPCLQKLTLAYCYKLPQIHSSLGCHRSIEYVRVWKCPKLRMFPDIIRMKNLKTLDIAYCGLGNGGIPDSIDKLSNLQELDLSGNKISRLYLNLSQLRQLRLLNVSECIDLHTLPELPLSLTTLKADSCYSLTSFGDGYKNCKRLCQVSLIQGSIINDGARLLQYMLEGKAIENGSMVLRLEGVEVAKGFNPRLLRGGRYILQLPGNWCNDFCGFLVCAVIKSEYNMSSPSLAISINHMTSKIYSQDEMVWEESRNDGTWTWVGYVSFDSLKNTTWWDQTYKALEFNVEELKYKECRGFGVTLVEKKSVTGTSKKSEGYTNIFKIEHDSKSALMISLIVYHPVYRCNMNAAT